MSRAFLRQDLGRCRGMWDHQLLVFTTCWARWRLYHHLDFVDHNVLYFVRDPLIYKWWPATPNIPLGNFPSQMTDESDPGDSTRDYIIEFLSRGSKFKRTELKKGDRNSRSGNEAQEPLAELRKIYVP